VLSKAANEKEEDVKGEESNGEETSEEAPTAEVNELRPFTKGSMKSGLSLTLIGRSLDSGLSLTTSEVNGLRPVTTPNRKSMDSVS